MDNRHPKNVPGPFYVENNCCIACDAPRTDAPDLMGADDGLGNYHCHFKKQPETPEEVERAVWACWVSCTKAVRYAGDDPAILNRLKELGSADSSDVLQEGRLEESVVEVLSYSTLTQRP